MIHFGILVKIISGFYIGCTGVVTDTQLIKGIIWDHNEYTIDAVCNQFNADYNEGKWIVNRHSAQWIHNIKIQELEVITDGSQFINK